MNGRLSRKPRPVGGRQTGGMKALLVLPFVPVLWLSSCDSAQEPPADHEARIRREVEQRVDAIRSEMKVSEGRWRTARIVTFCLLAGGSLVWLFNGESGSSPKHGHPMRRDARNPDPGHHRRVIERPYEDEDESDPYPYRR